jgi:hypothetical protein
MGIKSLITLLAVGGIVGTAFYFRDGIEESFATGKEKITNVKDTLQEGSRGGSSYNDAIGDPVNYESNKPNLKSQNTQMIYVPIYQNVGQQSAPSKGDPPRESKSNPTLTQYIKNDKTKSSINNTFSSPWANQNPTEYNKKKYGVNYELLTKAVSKSESKRTVNEKKQIEAEKARQIWDSRSINNW